MSNFNAAQLTLTYVFGGRVSPIYIYGENHIFVPIFLYDSHFGPYILFSPLLVSIRKIPSILVLSINVLTAKCFVTDGTIKIIIINFILALKNATSASKFKKKNY